MPKNTNPTRRLETRANPREALGEAGVGTGLGAEVPMAVAGAADGGVGGGYRAMEGGRGESSPSSSPIPGQGMESEGRGWRQMSLNRRCLPQPVGPPARRRGSGASLPAPGEAAAAATAAGLGSAGGAAGFP